MICAFTVGILNQFLRQMEQVRTRKTIGALKKYPEHKISGWSNRIPREKKHLLVIYKPGWSLHLQREHHPTNHCGPLWATTIRINRVNDQRRLPGYHGHHQITDLFFDGVSTSEYRWQFKPFSGFKTPKASMPIGITKYTYTFCVISGYPKIIIKATLKPPWARPFFPKVLSVSFILRRSGRTPFYIDSLYKHRCKPAPLHCGALCVWRPLPGPGGRHGAARNEASRRFGTVQL